MMSHISVLSLHLCVGVYVVILVFTLRTTECLENRRSDQFLLAQNSKDVDIYTSDEQCKLKTDDNTKQRIDPFEMLPSNNMNAKTRNYASAKRGADDNPKQQWIDPFEMLPSDNMKNTKKSMDASAKREKQCEIFMQRFINLLLRRSGLTNYNLQHGSKKQVNFDFIIRGEDLAILQKYGESGRSEDIFAVNDVLTTIFGSVEKTVFSHRPSAFEHINIPFTQGISSFSTKFYSFIVDSPEASIPICVVVVSVAAFYLAYVTRSYKLAVFTVAYIVFAANFGITWYRMYQEEMSIRFYAQMKHSGAPAHCKGEQLSWYEHLFATLFGEDCEQYYKKHFTSPMSQVSLNAVFSESVSVFFLHPAEHIAKAYGDFISKATGSVPWYLTPFVFPIVCIIPILVLFIILALLLNYQISVSPFTGLRIIPHWGRSIWSKEQQENKNTEKLADTEHSSKRQHISNSLESAVASNDSSPLFLLNWPAVEKFLHTSQKGKNEVYVKDKEHNNKVCNNCQVMMSVPSYPDGSGDFSQNVPTLGIKKNPSSCRKENSACKHLKELKANVKQQRITCSGDCCIHNEASTLSSEDLKSVCEKAEEKSVQKIKATENKDISSCQCQRNNEAVNKESGSVSEKLKVCS